MDKLLWQVVTSHGTKLCVEKNTALNDRPGDPGGGIYVLEQGICALTGLTHKGEEQIYLYFHPPKMIGVNPVLVTQQNPDYSPSTVFSIITRTKCTLYYINTSTFYQLLEENHAFALFLVHTLSTNYFEVMNHFHSRIDDNATVRLCRLLLELSTKEAGYLLVPKFFTHAELAKYLGCHAVTVSRIMARLKQQNIIKKCHQGIIIESVPALEALIEAESDYNY